VGDGDGVANGIIVDPSGLSAGADLPGSSVVESAFENAGCFISAAGHESSNHPIDFLLQGQGKALAIMLLFLISLTAGRIQKTSILNKK
jgi:hypothetical protein